MIRGDKVIASETDWERVRRSEVDVRVHVGHRAVKSRDRVFRVLLTMACSHNSNRLTCVRTMCG